MSYKRKKRTDSVNEYIANLCEFDNMKCNLLTEDFDVFLRWFDKLRTVDARATWIFLSNHKAALTKKEITYVETAYRRKLE